MNDFVQRYAMLKFAQEGLTAKGQKVPAGILLAIADMENTAKVRLTPQQQQVALHHVEVAKMHYRQEAAERIAHNQRAEAQTVIDRNVGKLTDGMFGRTGGLNREQLNAVAAGKSVAKPQRLTQAQLDANVRQSTRALDPSGKGWSEVEWTARLDELADAEPHRYAQLTQQYKADPEQLRRTVDSWRSDRYEHGLRKRREASDLRRGSDPITDRAPNNGERRRAAVVNAYLEHTADAIEHDTKAGRSDALDDFEGRVSDDFKNESHDGALTRRAQIARAFEQHDQETV